MTLNGLNAEGHTIPVVAVALQMDVGYVIPQQELSTQAAIGDLPTADPHVAGALWSNAGVITISAG